MNWVRPANEYEAMIYVIDRLTRRFPDAGEDLISGLVVDQLEQLGSAPIRTYIPMLVEHDVRRQLRELTAHDRGSIGRGRERESVSPAPRAPGTTG